LTRGATTFADHIGAFLDFRQNAAHILLPIDQRAEWAFFTNGDDAKVQRLWAKEHGLAPKTSLEDILKAQIEEHRTEIFYNMDPTGWRSGFIRNLPGCVKHAIAWHASPFRDVSFSDYDPVIGNFPSILENRATGLIIFIPPTIRPSRPTQPAASGRSTYCSSAAIRAITATAR
jgi:hypothetical protein